MYKIGDAIYIKEFGTGEIVGITGYKNGFYYNIRFNKDIGIKSFSEDYILKLLLEDKFDKWQKVKLKVSFLEFVKNNSFTSYEKQYFIKYIKLFNSNTMRNWFESNFNGKEILDTDVEKYLKDNNICKEYINIDYDYIYSHNREFMVTKAKNKINSKEYISIIEKKQLYADSKLDVYDDLSELDELIDEHNEHFIKYEFLKLPNIYEFIKKDKFTEDEKHYFIEYLKLHNSNAIKDWLQSNFNGREILDIDIEQYLIDNNICKEYINIDYEYIHSHNKKFVVEKVKKEIYSKEYISITERKYLYRHNKADVYDDLSELNEIIDQHNKYFVQNEIKKYRECFCINGYELNYEQKIAIVTDETSQLVVAGAGCGKTSMLLGKVRYLLEKGINPSEILLLSYTKKTVADINNHLNKLQIQPICKTFHSLGNKFCINERKKYNANINIGNIINNILYTDMLPQNKNDENSIISKVINIVSDIFNFTEENNLKKRIFDYISKHPRSTDVSLEDGEHKLQEFLEQKIPTLKHFIGKAYSENITKKVSSYEKKQISLNGDYVKSIAEAKIANFLFVNGVDYKYEAVYEKDFYCVDDNNGDQKSLCVYNPDFCITNRDGIKIWLEHFSVTNETDGIHARWLTTEDEKEYITSMKNKRYTHKKNNTILIETNSDDYREDKLFTKLQKLLEQYNVELNPLSEEKILKYIQKLHNRQMIKGYTDYFERFINLFKAQSTIQPKYRTLEELKHYLLITHCRNIEKVQIIDFFNIIEPIYNLYEDVLAKMNHIDFNDMIDLAIKKINIEGLSEKYKYILVDEYQDITYKRYEFLHLLQERNNAKIFCVGDDWQSIYGFSGSDISLFTDFNSMFPNAQEHLKLNTTYRNSNELINIAGNFIQKNPMQLRKELISNGKNKDLTQSIKGVYYHFANDDSKNIVSSLKIAIEDILKQYKTNETICVIGRYNINKSSSYFIPKYDEKKDDDLYYSDQDNNGNIKIRYTKYCDLDISFSTIHKAKGLEYDYVIFLDGDINFPYSKPEDLLLLPLLHKKETFFNEEERRMFYVALTRCKKNAYLLINEYAPSIFYSEVQHNMTHINDTFEEYCEKNNKEICPICHNGVYEEHKNKQGSIFWACNNFYCKVQTVNKIIKKCPKCGDGFLIMKNGPYGYFLGCTNYGKKNCVYSERI